jgi:hypothetical protein
MAGAPSGALVVAGKEETMEIPDITELAEKCGLSEYYQGLLGDLTPGKPDMTTRRFYRFPMLDASGAEVLTIRIDPDRYEWFEDRS